MTNMRLQWRPSPLPLLRPLHARPTCRLAAQLPARDRVVDFGKYKGRMLGTLPSKYLTWVSRNLRAGDFLRWADLADEVLRDPYYKDRLEWELAENVLHGDGMQAGRSPRAVSDLLELSERLGWDNEDKDGWKRVDFSLLGTSKGGRIPRLGAGRRSDPMSLSVEEKKKNFGSVSDGMRCSDVAEKSGREERRGRQRLKRQGLMREVRSKVNGEQEQEVEKIDGIQKQVLHRRQSRSNPFPGRDTLLKQIHG